MTGVRITRRFAFDMAHALWEYDGPCRNIHGHSYKLHVTLFGVPLHDKGNPKDGMVYDFSELKKIVERSILSVFDHALVLSDREDKTLIQNIAGRYERVVILSMQPSCENLLIHFRDLIRNELPQNLTLVSLRLDETINSFAEWKIEDEQAPWRTQ